MYVPVSIDWSFRIVYAKLVDASVESTISFCKLINATLIERILSKNERRLDVHSELITNAN
jgi:hypothetical protein